MMLADILSRHRGPFLFCLTRPVEKTKNWATGRYSSEWLKSEVQKEDVVEEARSLLTDPRDTVSSIGVWSQKENVFVTLIRTKDL